jgi:hypothetical protein
MPERPESITARRDELLELHSSSAQLAGLCITVVALMNTFDKSLTRVSIVDDIFAICAAAFLVCIYLIFWALRSYKARVAITLIRLVDGLFLGTISVMTAATFVMIYTIW